MSGLTGAERETVEKAREIVNLHAVQVREYTGDEDLGMAFAVAFGRAQWELGNLLRIVERLAGETESLAAIRQVLARFDWEHDDRQYALEAVERIAQGGQA